MQKQVLRLTPKNSAPKSKDRFTGTPIRLKDGYALQLSWLWLVEGSAISGLKSETGGTRLVGEFLRGGFILGLDHVCPKSFRKPASAHQHGAGGDYAADCGLHGVYVCGVPGDWATTGDFAAACAFADGVFSGSGGAGYRNPIHCHVYQPAVGRTYF
jgi:hypothetical protein